MHVRISSQILFHIFYMQSIVSEQIQINTYFRLQPAKKSDRNPKNGIFRVKTWNVRYGERSVFPRTNFTDLYRMPLPVGNTRSLSLRAIFPKFLTLSKQSVKNTVLTRTRCRTSPSIWLKTFGMVCIPGRISHHC